MLIRAQQDASPWLRPQEKPETKPPAPADIEAMQKQLGDIEGQLKNNPNDPEAKSHLANLEREVRTELGAEERKGDNADLKQLANLEQMLADTHQAMSHYGVTPHPGPSVVAANPVE